VKISSKFISHRCHPEKDIDLLRATCSSPPQRSREDSALPVVVVIDGTIDFSEPTRKILMDDVAKTCSEWTLIPFHEVLSVIQKSEREPDVVHDLYSNFKQTGTLDDLHSIAGKKYALECGW